jgi:hypothetical protein
LMQHYGVPTRLLDWTQSMWVAAYFAVEREPDEDGAIWVVHPRSVRAAMHQKFKNPQFRETLPPEAFWTTDAPHDVEFMAPTRETDRMTAQQTVFSLSRWVLSDAIIGDAVKQEQDPEKPVRYMKVVISHKAKLPMLRRLRQMSITASSLFPGIDGLGRSLAELARLAALDASQGGAIDATEQT